MCPPGGDAIVCDQAISIYCVVQPEIQCPIETVIEELGNDGQIARDNLAMVDDVDGDRGESSSGPAVGRAAGCASPVRAKNRRSRLQRRTQSGGPGWQPASDLRGYQIHG